jgi:hypothetical protein
MAVLSDALVATVTVAALAAAHVSPHFMDARRVRWLVLIKHFDERGERKFTPVRVRLRKRTGPLPPRGTRNPGLGEGPLREGGR